MVPRCGGEVQGEHGQKGAGLMAFYTLYYIVHRRTDFVDLYRIARQLAYPEWYEEHEDEKSIFPIALSTVLMLSMVLDY